MQPFHSLYNNATLHASRRDNLRKTVQLCTVVSLMLLMFVGASRTAAALCKDGDPTSTTIVLDTPSGYQLRLNLWMKDGDQLRGMMFSNAAHPGEHSIQGSVVGQINPDRSFSITVYLEPPPQNTQLLIRGILANGGGRGEVNSTAKKDKDKTLTWIAHTVKGCPNWPEDLFRAELASAADAQAASAAPAVAAANPLYACSTDSWDPSVLGSPGQQFVSDCANKIVNVLPWGPNSGSAAARTGPGSMAWNACAASLSKQVSTLVLTMQRACRTAKQLQEAKNRCIPVHTTRDGKIYQNEPNPFTSEGKDVQQCMTEVQRCFDHNSNDNLGAQESCANQVLSCFDTGDDKPDTTTRLFAAGGASAIRANTSRANIFCLLTKSPANAKSTFVPYQEHGSILGGLSNSRIIGSAYADAAASAIRCPARFADLEPNLFQRSSLSLFYADRFDVDTPTAGTRLLSFNSDSGCLTKTPAAAAIPVTRATSKLINSRAATTIKKSSSGYDGSYSGQSPAKRALQGGAAATAPRSSSGFDTVRSSTSNPAMDRQNGGAGAISHASTSSSGADMVKAGGAAVTRPSTGSSSGISTVQSGGTSLSRPSALDMLSTQRSGGAAAFRPQPSCNFGNCPR